MRTHHMHVCPCPYTPMTCHHAPHGPLAMLWLPPPSCFSHHTFFLHMRSSIFPPFFLLPRPNVFLGGIYESCGPFPLELFNFLGKNSKGWWGDNLITYVIFWSLQHMSNVNLSSSKEGLCFSSPSKVMQGFMLVCHSENPKKFALHNFIIRGNFSYKRTSHQSILANVSSTCLWLIHFKCVPQDFWDL